MLPESSIVNMMFGLTGLSPCNGTSASVGAIVTASSASGWSPSATATMLAQNFVKPDRRLTFIGTAPKGTRFGRGLPQHGLRVGHGVARSFDAHRHAIERVAGTDQSDVVLGARVGTERAGREVAVGRDRGAGIEAHPLDHVAAAVS